MNHPTRSLAALSLTLALAACGGGGSSGNLTISARTAVPAAGAQKIDLVGGRVSVERVRMVIRDIKLARAGLPDEVNAANGPFLLDLSGTALDGGITQLFDAEVPAGTYDELRFVVHKLEDLERTGDPVIDALRASIVLDLTVDGETVRFTSDVNEQQRIPGTYVVGEGGTLDNVTLSIDPAGWFGTAGAFVDPRVSGNQQAIEENIQASIDAFEDDDRDGDDDGPDHT